MGVEVKRGLWVFLACCGAGVVNLLYDQTAAHATTWAGTGIAYACTLLLGQSALLPIGLATRVFALVGGSGPSSPCCSPWASSSKRHC